MKSRNMQMYMLVELVLIKQGDPENLHFFVKFNLQYQLKRFN